MGQNSEGQRSVSRFKPKLPALSWGFSYTRTTAAALAPAIVGKGGSRNAQIFLQFRGHFSKRASLTSSLSLEEGRKLSPIPSLKPSAERERPQYCSALLRSSSAVSSSGLIGIKTSASVAFV